MNLKAIREQRQLTQMETATKCDISLTTIERIERGKNGYEPSIRIKRKLIKGLKIKPEELEG
jgi:DNA-binding XRE family transcriptional regulator